MTGNVIRLCSRKRKLMYEESNSGSEYDVSDDSTIDSYSVDYQGDYQDNEVGERIDLQYLNMRQSNQGSGLL